MKAKSKNVEIEITEADHEQMLAEGADREYALKPGRYKTRRGGFQERHPNVDASAAEAKVRITIYLDAKVIEHFKKLAAKPNAAGYQTLINEVLRQMVEHSQTHADFTWLVHNDAFITAVAERLEERLRR
jgi:uncharacterized protein (DUF4415 family)